MKICKPHEIIGLVAPYLPDCPIIIEAGAFDGTDSIKLIKQWPQATIHAFEPVPQLFERLVQKTAKHPQIHPHQLALDAHDGSALFYISEKRERPGMPSQANSLRQPFKRLAHSPIHFPHAITVTTISLATFMQQQHIERIDMLWLDAQGHEMTIMQSLGPALAKVGVIVAEVSFIEAYRDQPLYDEIKQWLDQQGFTEQLCTFADRTSWFFGNAAFINKALLIRSNSF